MHRLPFACLLALFAMPSRAFEVRIHPGDFVLAYENVGEGTPRGLATAVIQNVAFVNSGSEPVTLEEAWIEARSGGEVRQRVVIPRSDLERSAQQFAALAQMGALELYDFQFQTRRYLAGLGFAAGRDLAPGQALVVTSRSLLFQGLPDELVVTARGRRAGAAVETSTRLAVRLHQSPNQYWLPVKGHWVAAAGPSLHSHHRWSTIQEFAFDFIRFGADGLTHSGDGSKLGQFYAYGQPVSAIGEGVVVAAVDGLPEADANLQQPGEAAEAYAQRVMQSQQVLLAKGFAAILGNHVIVEHPGKEFSYYVHLQPGSVAVKPGDRLGRGQLLGKVGHSGNSTEPHLHFHLADGPDPGTSRSLPVSFANVTLWPSDDGSVRHLHSGQVLTSDP
ncbi:MAG TPA: M23 family metallopeptidase [Thermoanaerobaculia bacterium]|nr:M23 family metallopeptidase [Thermoanaerobaculia bacterium]